MSNMPEINLDEVDNDTRALVALHVVQRHHALVKANRFLLVLVFVLMSAVFGLGLFLLPQHHAWDGMKATDMVYASVQNPVIAAELSTLKGQMFGLVSGSIESKLRSLEESIRRGSVSDSLNTLQDLKSDVKVLNSYSSDTQARPQDTVINQQLIQELSDLKGLVYLTFVSCGLMIAAVAGVWLRQRRLTHLRIYKGLLGRKD
jgi:hypothetical protein